MKVLIDQLENLLLDLKEKRSGDAGDRKKRPGHDEFRPGLEVRYLRPGRDRVIEKPFLPSTPTDKDWTICFYRRTFASRADWRLPTLAELETLLDRTRGRAVVREAVPFKDALPYWSDTTFE